MEFRYQLVPDDHAALALNVFTPGGPAARRQRYIRFGPPAILVLLTLSSVPAHHGLTYSDLFELAMAAGWIVVAPTLHARLVARAMRRLAHSGLSRGSTGFRELLVDAHGVTERTPYGAFQRHWNGVERIAETPDHLFVYYGLHAAFIVPKSWLGDSVSALRHAIESAMTPAAVP